VPLRIPTIIYVDGFNLYYGAVKGTPYKWLDLGRFFRLLRPHDDIISIRYFSALVMGPTRPNQETYLQALATTPEVDVLLGNFKRKRVKCLVQACTATCNKFFEVQEEKRTDVNIAVSMLDDAYQGKCDQMILVSGDSDLVPPIRAIRSRFTNIKCMVYVPAQHPTRAHAVELRTAAHASRDLPLNLLSKAQFPTTLNTCSGVIRKPASW
jgi:hypothetical protein